jgi:import inner membrane translocase subunit TIM44
MNTWGRTLSELQQTYNVLWATMDQYLKSGLVSDSRVLDIRQVDISSGKLLEVADSTLPVWVVTFNTQEVCYILTLGPIHKI